MDMMDNCFEWYTGDNIATVTFSQKKWVNKIKKMIPDHPEIELVVENEDGSIVAHVPTSWFKFSPPRKGRELSAEEKAEATKRLVEGRKRKKNEN